jgi:hypothetical protein
MRVCVCPCTCRCVCTSACIQVCIGRVHECVCVSERSGRQEGGRRRPVHLSLCQVEKSPGLPQPCPLLLPTPALCQALCPEICGLQGPCCMWPCVLRPGPLVALCPRTHGLLCVNRPHGLQVLEGLQRQRKRAHLETSFCKVAFSSLSWQEAISSRVRSSSLLQTARTGSSLPVLSAALRCSKGMDLRGPGPCWAKVQDWPGRAKLRH